jgi:hypothetical protein
MILQSASSSGGIQDIMVCIDETKFSWGFLDSRNHVAIPLKEIGRLQSGLPQHMTKIFSEDIERRAFHLILKDKPRAATFLASNEKKRDAILTGFHAILEMCG